MYEMSKEAKEAKRQYMREYMRNYRQQNKDKLRSNQANYWERVAAQKGFKNA